MDKYETGWLWLSLHSRPQELQAEAERERLVRQAKEGHKRNLNTTFRLRKTLGRGLVKLGERLALAPQWDEA